MLSKGLGGNGMRQRRAPAPITARQIDTFRRELTQRECSPGTVENYIRSVRAFARWNREAPVTRGRAAEWRRSLAETHAPATVNAMLAGLSKFFTLTGREDCRVRRCGSSTAAFARRSGS